MLLSRAATATASGLCRRRLRCPDSTSSSTVGAVLAPSFGSHGLPVRAIATTTAAAAAASIVQTAAGAATTMISNAPNRAVFRTPARYMSKKKKGNNNNNNNKNNNKVSSSPPKNKFMVSTVYDFDGDAGSLKDYADDEEEMVADTLEKFREAVAEATYLEEEDTLKIFNSKTKQFELLTSLKQVQEEQDREKRVYIQPQAIYDKDGDDDDYGDDLEKYGQGGGFDDDEYADYLSRGSVLEDSIRSTAQDLKRLGWTRGFEAGTLIKDGEAKTARDILLQEAMGNEELQKLLLGRIGVLDHIAECVLYDFVWDAEDTGKDDDDDDSNEEEEEKKGK